MSCNLSGYTSQSGPVNFMEQEEMARTRAHASCNPMGYSRTYDAVSIAE